MKKCLIYLEKQYETDCLGLLGIAQLLYGEGYESTAVCGNADCTAAKGTVDRIIQIPVDPAAAYDARPAAQMIRKLQEEERYDCILIAATWFGRMLAPYTAALLECGLVADVTEVQKKEDGIVMIRPAFGGRLMAMVEKTGSGPVMMSVRPGVFTAEPVHTETEISVWEDGIPGKEGIVLLEKQEKPKHRDIRESEILVSGGGGAMEHFDLLNELADLLGGAVSASRKAVDSGKADRVIQVGQSGRYVRPKLYIAEGIYGAVQHVAGIKQADHMIAVNTDRYAPICSLADVVVEGDAAGFTRKLIRRIKEEKNN